MVNRAYIHRGTEYEISWDADEPVTPELVDRIKLAGNELSINWGESQFYSAIEMILSELDQQEVLERLYDEDPDLIETIALIMQSPLQDNLERISTMVRLYIPVLIILVEIIST